MATIVRKASTATGSVFVALGILLIGGSLFLLSLDRNGVFSDSAWQDIWEGSLSTDMSLLSYVRSPYLLAILGVAAIAVGIGLRKRGKVNRARLAVWTIMGLAGVMLWSQAWMIPYAGGLASGQAHDVTVTECMSRKGEPAPLASHSHCTFEGGWTPKRIYGYDWDGSSQSVTVVDGPTQPCLERTADGANGPCWAYTSPGAEDLTGLSVWVLVIAGGGVWLARTRRAENVRDAEPTGEGSPHAD